jgi:hypothetical protein
MCQFRRQSAGSLDFLGLGDRFAAALIRKQTSAKYSFLTGTIYQSMGRGGQKKVFKHRPTTHGERMNTGSHRLGFWNINDPFISKEQYLRQYPQ